MSGHRSHHNEQSNFNERPSLDDIPAFAGSSFARSLLDGGDYSHLLYDDQNDTVTSPLMHNSLSAQQFRPTHNTRLERNIQTSSERSMHSRTDYRSNFHAPINPSERRRHSTLPYSRNPDNHSSETPSWNRRDNATERRPRETIPNEIPTPHEGLPPSLLPCSEQPKKSRDIERVPDCLTIGNSFPLPSDGFELDHRIQKIKICEKCGEPLPVSKFHTLVRCHKCEMVMYNSTSSDIQ